MRHDSLRTEAYLDDSAVDVGWAHNLVLADQLVLVHGTEDITPGDRLVNDTRQTFREDPPIQTNRR